MENDAAVRKAAVDRSPRFPFIPLAKALERASQFYDHEKRGMAPYAAAAQHWEYSPTSSGALQTFAALRSYGLLDGTRKGVKLTDLALRILLDRRPDSGERDALMRQAALMPTVAAEVNAKWPDNLPSDATLNHFLVLERGFNEATALKAIEILKHNEGLTSSARKYGISDTGGINDGSDMQQQMQEKPAASQPTGRPPMPQNLTKHVRVEQIAVPGAGQQAIELRISGVPTKRVYEFLQAYAVFMASQCEAETTPTETKVEGQTF